MFKSYLKTSVRNLLNYKTYSFINIFGLTIGITCLIFIFKYVRFELSFDKFHKNADQIYRVTESILGGENQTTQVPLGNKLQEFIPEISRIVRINKLSKKLVSTDSKKFYEERIILADPSIFDMFSFDLIAGDKKTVLNDPWLIVLTEQTAQKYFGKENPIGKRITIDEKYEFQVSGILKDLPKNSHINIDFLCPLISAKNIYSKDFFDNLMSNPVYTYIQFNGNIDSAKINARLLKFPEYFYKEYWKVLQMKFGIEPLTSIHLNPTLENDLGANGNISNIYIFSSIGLLILLIACINYMNLSTARYLTRIKEVGIRKVVGASRSQIIIQFIGESILLTFLAVILSLILVKILAPTVGLYFGEEEIFQNSDISFLIYISIITLVTGIIAGIYPALFVSKFQPVNILSKEILISKSRISFRSILVIFQFAISTILIIITMIIKSQLSFIQNKDLGFTKEQIVILPVEDNEIRHQYRAIKNELLKNPAIMSASFSSSIPGGVNSITSFHWEGQQLIKNTKIIDNTLSFISSDYAFLKTYGINIKEGRNFSESFPSDEKQGYIINQAALTKLNLKSPLGKSLNLFNRNGGRIIGMVKDFHFQSLHKKIEPLAIFIDEDESGYYIPKYLSIRIKTDNIPLVLSSIEKTWKQFSPGRPFEYFFFDEYLSKLYKKEQNTVNLFNCFSIVAVFIASLGLFGLAAFTSESRKKEIGIRKVLGASVAEILVTLSGSFMKKVLIANLIAWPVAYYLINRWLQDFAYHVQISVWIFVLAAIISILITLVTVSYHVIKAAVTNPVNFLKYE